MRLSTEEDVEMNEAQACYQHSSKEKISSCKCCGRLINDQFLLKISAWFFHESCAICSVCKVTLCASPKNNDNSRSANCRKSERRESCFERDGRLFCKMHYLNDKTSTQAECAGCKVFISPNDMVYKLKLGIVYHVKCHVCFKCGKQLTPGERIIVDEATKSVSCVLHYTQRPSSNNTSAHESAVVLNGNSTNNLSKLNGSNEPTSIIPHKNETTNTGGTAVVNEAISDTIISNSPGVGELMDISMNSAKLLPNFLQLSNSQNYASLLNGGNCTSGSNFSDDFYSLALTPPPLSMPSFLLDQNQLQPPPPPTTSLMALMNDYQNSLTFPSFMTTPFTAHDDLNAASSLSTSSHNFSNLLPKVLPKAAATAPLSNNIINSATSCAIENSGLKSENDPTNILTFAAAAAAVASVFDGNESSSMNFIPQNSYAEGNATGNITNNNNTNFVQLMCNTSRSSSVLGLGAASVQRDDRAVKPNPTFALNPSLSLSGFGTAVPSFASMAASHHFPLPQINFSSNSGSDLQMLPSAVNSLDTMKFLQSQFQLPDRNNSSVMNPYVFSSLERREEQLHQEAFLRNFMAVTSVVPPLSSTVKPSLPLSNATIHPSLSTSCSATATLLQQQQQQDQPPQLTKQTKKHDPEMNLVRQVAKSRYASTPYFNKNSNINNNNVNNSKVKIPSKKTKAKSSSNDLGIDKVLKDRLKKFGIFRSSSPSSNPPSSPSSSDNKQRMTPTLMPTNAEKEEKLSGQTISDNHHSDVNHRSALNENNIDNNANSNVPKYPFEMYTFGEMYANADSKYLKRRGPRTSIKQEQLDMLNEIFLTTPKPSKHARAKLAMETGLSMRVIQVWFQNRRSKERRLKHLCNFLRHYEQNGTEITSTDLLESLENEFESRLFNGMLLSHGESTTEFSDYLEFKLKEKIANLESRYNKYDDSGNALYGDVNDGNGSKCDNFMKTENEEMLADSTFHNKNLSLVTSAADDNQRICVGDTETYNYINYSEYT